MSVLIVIENEGELVVDSRLIAQELNIEHRSFMDTMTAYKTLVEQEFGVLRFETAKPQEGSKGGRPARYALLTEDQSIFLMTLVATLQRWFAVKSIWLKSSPRLKRF